MTKLWIDVLTPKQVLFTKSLIQRAPSKFKITVSTRDYSELNQFLSLLRFSHTSVGKHGGGELLAKLEASTDRQRALIDFIKEKDFDISLSFVSPEAARVSFGLGIEHLICSDSPHANAPCRLAVPLSSRVFCPFVIPKRKWTQYSIKADQVMRYHALDPWCWLLSLKADGMDSERKNRVLIRLEEWFASYAKEGKGISNVLHKLVDEIRAIGDFEILLVPRYDDQRGWAKREFGKVCTVPETAIDGVQAILGSDLVIGGGATMTQEAALLGIPNISYFPSVPLDVFEDFYHPSGLSVKASTPEQLLGSTRKLLRNIDLEKKRFSSKAKKIVARFEDPAKFIFDNIRADPR